MKTASNANINSAATAITGGFVSTTLCAIPIAARLITSFGFAGRVNGTLGEGRACLSLNLGKSLGHSVLGGHSVRKNRNLGQRDLHTAPSQILSIYSHSLLKKQFNQAFFNEKVANMPDMGTPTLFFQAGEYGEWPL